MLGRWGRGRCLSRVPLLVLLSVGPLGCTTTSGTSGPPSPGPALQINEVAQAVRILAEGSPIVVRARVVKANASEEPMVAASQSTVVVAVQETYAGAEIAMDQRGRNATIILTRPGLRLTEGTEGLFFGAPRFIGAGVTIADQGEIIADANAPAIVDAVQRGVRARQNGPLFESLSSATLVFRGTVEQVRPLEARGGARAKRREVGPSEHDPEWQIATIRVTAALRGAAPAGIVTVVFPASQDIVWFQVPKLRPGQDAVLVTRTLTAEEKNRYREPALLELASKEPAYFVLHPVDVQPVSAETHVRSLLSGDKEAR